MVIYCVTNLLNGKQYIGQTIKSAEERWRRHCWAVTGRTCTMAITLAIVKHGKDNFRLETLCTCASREELSEMEKHFIKEKGTMAPLGYNLTPGGETVIHTPETIARISAKQRGKVVSEETREKLRLRGLGRKLSKETCEAMRRANSGKQPCEAARSNSVKASVKTYWLRSPLGELVKVTNMAALCRGNGLKKPKMCLVAAGKRKSHCGWTAP